MNNDNRPELDEYDAPDDPIIPNYYKVGGLEVIDILKTKLLQSAFVGFLQGNCLKYLFRAENKNGIEDLKKARWYLDYLISFLEERKTNGNNKQ